MNLDFLNILPYEGFCRRHVPEIINSIGLQAWLDQHGPFDAVVDGANVGLYGQNWDQSVNFHQVNYMNASGAGIATFYSIVSHIKYIAHVDVTHLQK